MRLCDCLSAVMRARDFTRSHTKTCHDTVRGADAAVIEKVRMRSGAHDAVRGADAEVIENVRGQLQKK